MRTSPEQQPGEGRARRKSPQEKKRLSYRKDRRNNYGENDKSSRRNIPLARRAAHHALRGRERLALERIRAYGGQLDDGQALFARRTTGRWRKWPDAPLGELVVGGLRRRARVGMDAPERNAERIERVRRRLSGRSR
ncbi:hypothetical protein ABT095_13770 [Kitasatospora sp. NPDC002227]|uniref:hypothetical protein n=1 Tax=Kitasatospora sp. NPDC002227 TaxID=3154773 RepID=UPI00331E06DF